MGSQEVTYHNLKLKHYTYYYLYDQFSNNMGAHKIETQHGNRKYLSDSTYTIFDTHSQSLHMYWVIS